MEKQGDESPYCTDLLIMPTFNQSIISVIVVYLSLAWNLNKTVLRWESNSWQWHLWVQRVWYFCILIFSPPGPVLLVWEWYQKIKFSVKSHSTCPSLTVCGNSWSSSKVTFDCICFLGWWLHYLDQIGRNGPESWFCLIDHISNKTALQLCKFRMITDTKERLPFTVFFCPNLFFKIIIWTAKHQYSIIKFSNFAFIVIFAIKFYYYCLEIWCILYLSSIFLL